MKKLFKIIMTAVITVGCMMSCKKVEPVDPVVYSVTGAEYRAELIYESDDSSMSGSLAFDSFVFAAIDLNFKTDSTGVLTLYTFDYDVYGINYEAPDDSVSYRYTYNHPDIFIYDDNGAESQIPENENEGFKLTANETRDALVFTNFKEYLRIWLEDLDADPQELNDFLKNIVSTPVFYIKPKN